MSKSPPGIFDYAGNDADPLYVACRDHETKSPVRDRIERWWEMYRPVCADVHFLDEIQRQFVQRSWELYLAGWLLENGFELQRPPPNGPDFLVAGPQRFWIEATTVGRGDDSDSLPRRVGKRIINLHEETVLLRYTSALATKAAKVGEYRDASIVGASDPVFVAISGARIQDADLLDVEMPLIVKAVFPIGEVYMGITPYSDQPPTTGYLDRPELRKMNKATVATTPFLSCEHNQVAGVLFSSVGIWNTPDRTGADLALVHNPTTRNPFARGLLPVRREYWLQKGQLRTRDYRGNTVAVFLRWFRLLWWHVGAHLLVSHRSHRRRAISPSAGRNERGDRSK